MNARSSAGRCPRARKTLGTNPDLSATAATRSRRSSGSCSSSTTGNLLTSSTKPPTLHDLHKHQAPHEHTTAPWMAAPWMAAPPRSGGTPISPSLSVGACWVGGQDPLVDKPAGCGQVFGVLCRFRGGGGGLGARPTPRQTGGRGGQVVGV